MPLTNPMTSVWRTGLVALSVAALAVGGCSRQPTYPKARLSESLTALLAEEGVEVVAVKLVDHTLGVQCGYPDALSLSDGQIGVGPAFQDAVRKILTAVHRVTLSSDADVRFYVVLLSDPTTPGAYLTMVRYMDDIRRANVSLISSSEMFDRTVFDLSVAGPTQVALDRHLPRDIQLEEFLSWQLARRIQATLSEALGPAVAEVGRCGGAFEDGEFAFTLNVAPTWEALLDEATLQRVFQVSTRVIAEVLASYRFDAFDAVRLIHPFSGRSLTLPKTHLDVFR
jgi:hypothetical protein